MTEETKPEEKPTKTMNKDDHVVFIGSKPFMKGSQ